MMIVAVVLAAILLSWSFDVSGLWESVCCGFETRGPEPGSENRDLVS